ncbi:MAG: HD domain-containing protein [Rikenellaceae bacterium]
MKDIVAQLVIEYYSRHPEWMRDDILHTQEVVSYTRLIAIGEGMSEPEVALQEAAAWLHDIGCPRSKELYGNSLPVNQQNIGCVVAAELIKDLDCLTPSEKEWLADVVGTHHQFPNAQRLGYLPLFEADLIVNLLSGYHPREKAEHLYDTFMTTKSGKELFKVVIK